MSDCTLKVENHVVDKSSLLEKINFTYGKNYSLLPGAVLGNNIHGLKINQNISPFGEYFE